MAHDAFPHLTERGLTREVVWSGPATPGEAVFATDATAGGSFQEVWDLGDQWCRWTGLPFVFAAWAARSGVAAERFAGRLEAARDSGLANLAAIAAAEAAPHGLTVPQCLSYLRDNLHYHLGVRELDAVRAFRTLAGGLGLVPVGSESSAPLSSSR